MISWHINSYNQRMTRRQMTLIYYHVPQDKDDPECPNVFGVPFSKQELKLTHIHDNFPLKGSYLFRFRSEQQGIPVWMDQPDVNAPLPLYKGRVVVKATRVSWGESKLHSQYRGKENHQQKEEKKDFMGSDLLGDSPHKKQKEVSRPKVDLMHGFDSNNGDLI